jgi:methylated-DNA-[protein]-cysteine S-methyltransferase
MDPSRQTLRMTTTIGELELVAEGGELIEVHMEPQAHSERTHHTPDGPIGDASSDVLATTQRQLEDYFAGKPDTFSLPTSCKGTEFQKAVWDALREVGYGETTTYGELAARIGRPGAARAVGQALAANPLPIVVPCHRVVGHDGRLTGFGGGIDRKRQLLELEAH